MKIKAYESKKLIIAEVGDSCHVEEGAKLDSDEALIDNGRTRMYME